MKSLLTPLRCTSPCFEVGTMYQKRLGSVIDWRSTLIIQYRRRGSANGALRGRPHYPDPAAQGLHSPQELGDTACLAGTTSIFHKLDETVRRVLQLPRFGAGKGAHRPHCRARPHRLLSRNRRQANGRTAARFAAQTSLRVPRCQQTRCSDQPFLRPKAPSFASQPLECIG